ncbi:MAG: hypothetical protein DRJ66_05170 [Thermoprotei archaeon]|nr:MAG: hypothetical protein DRJ66_05170 [Thermoprotei archaeon]RLF20211.1 MAG: hypothetical protein DRZ82_03180 [Thermoprotei archaeon]
MKRKNLIIATIIMIFLSVLCRLRMEYALEQTFIISIYKVVLSTPLLYEVASLISMTAEVLGVCIILLVITVYEQKVRKGDVKITLIELTITLSIAMIIALILKTSLKAPRPVSSYHSGISTYGFPSGHVARCSSIYSSYRKNKVLLFWTILVALSRIMLGAHYIIDVVGGYIVGYLAHCLVRVRNIEKIIRSL